MSIHEIKEQLGERLLHNEPMAKYTAARLGGSAEWLYVAKEPDRTEDLSLVLMHAWQADIPVRVIGGGANILVSDKGISGLVIVNRINEVRFGDWHDGRSVSATSGTSLTVLANKCQSQGYTGLEWAISVPGTVGGAIVNNAGAHGGDMAGSVADVVVLESGIGPRLYACSELDYGYRHSTLKARTDGHFLVLMATFFLKQDDPAVIKTRMDDFRTHRKETQPTGASLGSIFKNPEGHYAGKLIDDAGLKGHRIGGAMVSDVHGNFFMNDMGKATASDYRALIEHVQAVVETQTGILLQPEIEFVGNWD